MKRKTDMELCWRIMLRSSQFKLLLALYLLVLFMLFRVYVTQINHSYVAKTPFLLPTDWNNNASQRNSVALTELYSSHLLQSSNLSVKWLFENKLHFSPITGIQNDRDTLLSSDYFRNWAKDIRINCSGRLIGYSNVMLRFHGVVMDKQYSHVDAEGGRAIDGIMNQKEEEEVYKLRRGFFKLLCEEKNITYNFDKHSAHLKDWLSSIAYSSYSNIQTLLKETNPGLEVETKFTIAMMRYEFTNVYWVIMDLYNIYLTMSFFKKSLSETNVLIIDERPQNSLDNLYHRLYHARQLHSYPSQTIFKDLVWMFPRYRGPMLKRQSTIPLVSEFRRDVLQAFGLTRNHTRNCSALNIHFIWRRNYVAHPRNPSGLVWRKIKNEDELLNATRAAFATAHISGIQLDKLTSREQLAFISTTDLLIGMHGAAFGFALFLPPGGGAIEMFPQYVSANWHMEYLIKWAGVHYRMWKNKNKLLEDTEKRYTTIPPDIMLTLIKPMILKICPK